MSTTNSRFRLKHLTFVTLCLVGCGNNYSSSKSSAKAIVVPAIEIENSEFCITDARIFNGPVSLSFAAITCKTRDELTSILAGVAAYYGVIAAACVAAPEPVFTKATAAIFGLSGTAVGTFNFALSRASCTGEGRVDLATQRYIMKRICRETGRSYVESSGLNGEPGCAEK